jgi:hypothetical protein
MQLVRQLVPDQQRSLSYSHDCCFFYGLDSAILGFADNLISSDTIRARWHHVHKIPFNSKVSRSNLSDALEY